MSTRVFLDNPKLENGVKPRYDGGGTEFGKIHRFLGKEFAMFDVDKMSISITVDLELKNDNELFYEYKTNFNTGKVEFRALFELKYEDTPYVKKALECPLGSPTYAQWMACNRLSAGQKNRCRYFIVIAFKGGRPFHFYEIDANGEKQDKGVLNYAWDEDDGKEEVKRFWEDDLGL